MNFWHLVKVLKAKWWVVLGIIAVTLLVIAIAAPKPTVVYQASAYVSPSPQVMQGGISATSKENSAVTAPDRAVVLSNLIILAQSNEVFNRALKFLESDVVDQQNQLSSLNMKAFDRRNLLQVPHIEVSPGEALTYANYSSDVVEVAPVQNEAIGDKGTTTDIIRIVIKLRSGDQAPYLVNAIAQSFAQVYQEKSRSDTVEYRDFLKNSMDESRSKLTSLRQNIAEYKRQHHVVAVDAETQGALSSLAGLENVRGTAESSVREAEAALRDIDSQLKVQPLVTQQSMPAEMNPNVKRLQDELSQAEADLRVLAQRVRPAHDFYKAAEARIASLKDRIAKEGKSFSPPLVNDIHQELVKKRSDMQYNLATARAKLASATASLSRAQAKINNLAQAEPNLAQFMTDFAQADSNYKMLSDKYAQVLITEKEFTRTGSIQAYDLAYSATGPIVQGPSRRSLLLYGFVLSLVLGIVSVVWLDSIDNRMRNAADVEKLLELPVIGLTPQLTGRNGSLPKLTHLYPLSAMAESYRILRTNILFALRDNPFKTLMIATGRPGQGATTTISNLAIVLAQIGKRIILIDADMRRPSLHKFFDVPNDVGLSTLLQGQGAVTDAFQKTGIENLIVLPAGPQPTNPSELLGSERMHELVGKLEEHCDLVLFDSPSTVVFSDGPMLASWMDAVLMVVSANEVPRGTETQTRDLLRRARANIIGVVVNRMASDNIDSCHFYSAYYSDSVPQPGGMDGLAPGLRASDDDASANVSKVIPKAIPAPAMKSARAEADAKNAGSEVAIEQDDNPFPE